MARGTNCTRDLKEGEEFSLVRVQYWKTKVGSKECKQPDFDETRGYCQPCAKKVQVNAWKD